MSWQRADAPVEDPAFACKSLETVIVPRARDLGGFQVQRILPHAHRRMVGPFVFLDQMGPAELPAGSGIDVRPHPHIGLATLTYLFEGTIVHRDSLGSVQPIRPGEVNWMTAGRGIVHSERSDPEIRKRVERVAGLQAWVALPEELEELAPDFAHHPASALPTFEGEGARVRLIAGTLFGSTSPVQTRSELFYADALLEAGATLSIPDAHEERGAYLFEGSVEVAGERFEPGRLLVFRSGDPIPLRAHSNARVMLLGGTALGPRHIWWNFVSTRAERIEQAKEDWRRGRFPRVPGDDESTPLPESA